MSWAQSGRAVMTLLALQGLGLTYPGAVRPALAGLSLDIPSGSLTALLGPSGCGKTTALRIIAGLLAPDAGDVRCDGASILSLPPEGRGVVMVFQAPLLFPHLSVADNIGFGLRMRHMPRVQIAARVAEMLDLVQLAGFGARRPSELSGGQAQRVALARALILKPKVLLLDEPLSSLDAHLRAEMRDLIRRVQRSLGITTVFVTHDQEEAVVLADRIGLILDGQLHQYDQPEVFYQRPATMAVARFFGCRNFVPGRVEGGVFHSVLGELTLPPGMTPGQGVLTIRPEAVRIGPGVNGLMAVVTDRAFLGTQTRLMLQVGDVALEAVVSPDQATGIAVGQSVQVNLPPWAVWVMAG